MQKHIKFIKRLIQSVVFSVFFMISIVPAYSGTGSSTDFIPKIKHWLKKRLISVDPLPPSLTVDAVYILGGSQSSLEYKFKAVSEYYHNGVCRRIIILSQPGITEYSPSLGRNLTNDEWAVMKLKALEVSKIDIEAVDMEPGFFGTLTEARHISLLAGKRRYKSLMLVTAPYHTKRVKGSFTRMLGDTEISFYIRGSAEKASLSALIREYIKLNIYQYFLIQ